MDSMWEQLFLKHGKEEDYKRFMEAKDMHTKYACGTCKGGCCGAEQFVRIFSKKRTKLARLFKNTQKIKQKKRDYNYYDISRGTSCAMLTSDYRCSVEDCKTVTCISYFCTEKMSYAMRKAGLDIRKISKTERTIKEFVISIHEINGAERALHRKTHPNRNGHIDHFLIQEYLKKQPDLKAQIRKTLEECIRNIRIYPPINIAYIYDEKKPLSQCYVIPWISLWEEDPRNK